MNFFFYFFSKSNGGCDAEFCWLCLEKWSTHGDRSGKNILCSENFILFIILISIILSTSICNFFFFFPSLFNIFNILSFVFIFHISGGYFACNIYNKAAADGNLKGEAKLAHEAEAVAAACKADRTYHPTHLFFYESFF